MLTLPSDATHVLIGQLTKFFKTAEIKNYTYWMVYSQTLKKWVKLYSTGSRYGSNRGNVTSPAVREGHHFLRIEEASEYLFKAGVVHSTRSGDILISEENLKKIIRYCFSTGFAEAIPGVKDKEQLEMVFGQAESILKQEFVDLMVNWFDDRPSIKTR